jgi:hypothetical protein
VGHPAQHDEIVERMRAALAGRDFSMLEPVLAEDMRLGSCIGRAQTIEYLNRCFVDGLTIKIVRVEFHADCLIALLELRSLSAETLPFDARHPSATGYSCI